VIARARRQRHRRVLVGRHEERNLLARELDVFADGGLGGVVVLEGPPGIGKTSLLAELRRICRKRGLRMAWGNAWGHAAYADALAGATPAGDARDFVEPGTPLFALRSILRELLDVGAGSSFVDIDRRLREVFEGLGEDLDLLPLAREALGVEPVDTELTRQMIADVRAHNRNRLLAAIVAQAARERPVVVVIDDLHWCDRVTQALLPELTAVRGVLWAFATRTPENLPGVSGRMTRLPLRGLDESDIAAVAAGALGVAEVPGALTKLLIERAGGNPLYSRELVFSLRERGHVQVRNGRCHLADSFGQATTADLPDSLAELIKSRIDQLPQAAQVTLRVASVVGQSFERGVLADVLRSTRPSFEAESLDESLDILEQARFLQAESPASEGFFSFGHATTQNVARSLILPGQLASLHFATARALEHHEPRAFARLSHHWSEARDHPAMSPTLVAKKVTKYSMRAAREALDGFANVDAIALYDRAIRSHKIATGEREIDLRRSSLLAWRSRAYYSLTQVKDARSDLEDAFRFAGFQDFGTGTKALVNAVVLAIRYFFTKISGRTSFRNANNRARFRDLAGLAILGEWMVLDFWQARLVEGAAKAFLGYQLALRVRSSPLSAEAVARLGYLVGLTPFRSLGERELLRGVELAESSGELQARASSRVMLGMHYTLVGRLAIAAQHLEKAQDPANKLGGGLWRHRARFMLGEAMLCMGRFERARDAFAEAAQLSVGAERPVVGLSTCMGALAIARLGRFEEALALIDGPMGLPLIGPDRSLPLQRFASLGIKAEILGHMGRLSEAEEIARGSEVRLLVGEGKGMACSVFFAGLHGYAGILSIYLQLRLRSRDTKRSPPRALVDETLRAQKRLYEFAKLYPAARPRLELLTGRLHILDGRERRGRASLRRCLVIATQMNMPYEQALAHYGLSRIADDAAARRGEALRICRDIGMEHEERIILAEPNQQETAP
jgi:tetratricopeptide (TPR) repeat protein